MTPRICARRRGSVLIVALVCLAVVVAMLGTLFQGSLRARRQLHRERDRRQAELLLQAGLARAVHRLSKDADYRGEIWNLPASAVVGAGEGEVTITTARDAAEQPWRILVVAEYPHGGEWSIRRSRTIFIPSQE